MKTIKEIEKKQCKICKIIKPFIEFEIYVMRGKKYLRHQCKVCKSTLKKENYPKIANLRRKQANDWYYANKERVYAVCRIRYKKLRSVPSFKINRNIHQILIKALHGVLTHTKWEKVLKFKITDFKNHIENQFDEKMSWDNYAIYWELDHITPKSKFNYKSFSDKSFKDCWSLNNLRPLEVKANRQKNDRL